MSTGHQLPKDDLRAQELVVWLKRLSLEIPAAIKPVVDFGPVLSKLEEQACQLAALESLVKDQAQMMAVQVSLAADHVFVDVKLKESKVLSQQVAIMSALKRNLAHLEREPQVDNMHAQSSSCSTDSDVIVSAARNSVQTLGHTQLDNFVCTQSPRVTHFDDVEHKYESLNAKRVALASSPNDAVQSQHSEVFIEQKSRVPGRKRRLLSVQTTLSRKEIRCKNVLGSNESVHSKSPKGPLRNKRNLL